LRSGCAWRDGESSAEFYGVNELTAAKCIFVRFRCDYMRHGKPSRQRRREMEREVAATGVVVHDFFSNLKDKKQSDKAFLPAGFKLRLDFLQRDDETFPNLSVCVDTVRWDDSFVKNEGAGTIADAFRSFYLDRFGESAARRTDLYHKFSHLQSAALVWGHGSRFTLLDADDVVQCEFGRTT